MHGEMFRIISGYIIAGCKFITKKTKKCDSAERIKTMIAKDLFHNIYESLDSTISTN